jgi:apolipoprotein N-acyltransferase
MNAINKTLLLLIGAFFLTLSGINWYIGIAAWLAPLLLLQYTRNVKWIYILPFFLIVAVSGMISQSCNNLFDLFIIDLINGFSFAIFYSISYLVDKLLYKKGNHFIYTLVFPSIVVIIEFLVSSKIGTWGVVAHTQFSFKPFIQISSITGLYGISFMVTWAASVINWLIEQKTLIQGLRKGGIIYLTLFLAVVLFGFIKLKTGDNNSKNVKIACIVSETDVHTLVADNQETFKRLSDNYQLQVPDELFSDRSLLDSLFSRTQKASDMGAKIIVWNELSLILNQTQKLDLLSEIKAFCKTNQVYILPAFLEYMLSENNKPFYNRSVLLNPDGGVSWEYSKSFLHPYAESPVINAGNYSIPYIDTEYGRMGNVICADLDLPNYIAQAGKNSVDIMLVPAFDWEGITPLHSQMACLAGIQYGFAVVRSNGKGLSAVYDHKGNERSSMNTFKSDEKIVLAEIPIKSKSSIYSKTGEILAYLCFAFLLFITFIRIRKASHVNCYF